MRVLDYIDGFESASEPTLTPFSRASVAAGTANHVVINNGSGALSSEAQLATSRGGTGQNMSASTGLVKVSGGTFSAATLVNADVSASAGIQLSKLETLASGEIIVGSAANVPTARAVSGDINIGNTGVTAISAGVIVNADVNASAAIEFSKLAALSSGEILVGSAGNVPTARAMSGDINIGNTGITSISAGVIVNADVNASAAIDFSKLASLPSGEILVGSAGGVATARAMSGDINIGNTGITSISAGVIVNADINASAAIAYSKLSLTDSIVNADINTGAAIQWSKMGALTASRALVTSAGGVLTEATTTAAEIGHVNGVTSAIQTQLDAKTVKATLTAKGSIYAATAASTPAELAVGTNGYVLTANSAQSTGLEYKNIGDSVFSNFTVAAWPITVDQFGDLIAGGHSLTAGTWVLSANLYYDATGGATTTGELFLGISTTTGNSATGLTSGRNLVARNPAALSSGQSDGLSFSSWVVAPASTTTYYLKGFAGGSTTNLRGAGSFSAVRIK